MRDFKLGTQTIRFRSAAKRDFLPRRLQSRLLVQSLRMPDSTRMDDSVKAALKKCFDQKQRLQIRADTVGVSDRIYRRICGLAQQEVTISLPVSRSFPAETVEEPEFHGNIKIFSFSELEIFPSCAKLKTRKQAELAPNKNYYKGRKALMVTIDAGAHSSPCFCFFEFFRAGFSGLFFVR